MGDQEEVQSDGDEFEVIENSSRCDISSFSFYNECKGIMLASDDSSMISSPFAKLEHKVAKTEQEAGKKIEINGDAPNTCSPKSAQPDSDVQSSQSMEDLQISFAVVTEKLFGVVNSLSDYYERTISSQSQTVELVMMKLRDKDEEIDFLKQELNKSNKESEFVFAKLSVANNELDKLRKCNFELAKEKLETENILKQQEMSLAELKLMSDQLTIERDKAKNNFESLLESLESATEGWTFMNRNTHRPQIPMNEGTGSLERPDSTVLPIVVHDQKLLEKLNEKDRTIKIMNEKLQNVTNDLNHEIQNCASLDLIIKVLNQENAECNRKNDENLSRITDLEETLKNMFSGAPFSNA